MMRPLVMDFAGDQKALEEGDQFMFGPAMMVNPVMKAGATSGKFICRGRVAWFDFWTGEK